MTQNYEDFTPEDERLTVGEDQTRYTWWTDKETHRNLKSLAAQRDTTIRALISAGVIVIFEAYNIKPSQELVNCSSNVILKPNNKPEPD